MSSLSSQYIFKDKDMKARLINKDNNYYIGEYKTSSMETWFPWIVGTAEGLKLSQQEKEWAIK